MTDAAQLETFSARFQEIAGKPLPGITNPHYLENRDKPIVQALEQQVLARLVGIWPKRADAKYNSMEHWVLQHGRYFERAQLPPPKPYKTGTIKACYANTFAAASKKRSKLVYVEGFCLGLMPFHHAWGLVDGKAIELTLREGFRVVDVAYDYFGVPMRLEYVQECRYAGSTVIDHWKADWPLLRNDDLLKRAVLELG